MTNNKTNRCLYRSDFKSFIESDPYYILGRLHDAFHGQALTTTDEAWNSEINLLQSVLIFNPLITGANGLQNLIEDVLQHAGAEIPGTIKDWIISPYTPTPTIIEAARSLYENHSVEDITRHEADKVTTDATIAYILDVINRSKKNGEKKHLFRYRSPRCRKNIGRP